jgi:hypothetical protein
MIKELTEQLERKGLDVRFLNEAEVVLVGYKNQLISETNLVSFCEDVFDDNDEEYFILTSEATKSGSVAVFTPKNLVDAIKEVSHQ